MRGATFTFSGGTGRFEGASGTAQMTGVLGDALLPLSGLDFRRRVVHVRLWESRTQAWWAAWGSNPRPRD